MLLAAIIFGALYVEVAQAQGVDGAITGLTLTSDAPGTLTVSWDTASPTPTDYRVDWAKSDQDYQSWKVDEGHKYPDPSATTTTITDLSHDTEYKIRIRARYYKGEYYGKSWGGPWATASLEVAGTPEEESVPEPPAPPKLTPTVEPVRRDSPPQQVPALPAAPNLMDAAVSPEGEVMLVWQDPSDDSITGYQILRGHASGGVLTVIEDDTGSSGTSYTDTAPPAGETHTYAVKARNATGLSGISNTRNAIVPAPGEEPTVAPPTDPTLVSNLGQTAIEGAFAGTLSGSHYEIATSFTTGDNTPGYHLTSLQLYMNHLVGSTLPTPQVSIRDDNAGFPSETVLYTFTTSTELTNTWELITFTTPDEITLQPNTIYWLHVNATGGTAAAQQTASDDEDTESQAGLSIGDDRVFRINGGAWTTAAANYSLQIGILGHVIPPEPEEEPTVAPPTDPTLVSNLGQTAIEGAFAGTLSGSHYEIATSFTTGDNTPGYHLTSLQLYMNHLVGSTLPTPQVSIRDDNAGFPSETVLYTFTTSTELTNTWELITCTTPDEITLQPNTIYWLHVNATGGTAAAQQTASDDEDTESQAGLSIGDDRVFRI